MIKLFRALLLTGLAMSVATGAVVEERKPPALVAAKPGLAGQDMLSVMTYNVKGLAWPIAWGRDDALARIGDRLAAMRREGQQPHILLLQEAFTPQAAAIARRAGYAHVAAGPDVGMRTPVPAPPAASAFLAAPRWDRGEQMGKQMGSGLLILSDYPVIGVDRLAFPDFACAGVDCLANKGVLIAHLAVPGYARPVSVVNTHLNARKAALVDIARSQDAFARQADLVSRFVSDHVPHDHLLVLGGDMNIGGDADRKKAFFAAFAARGMDFVAPALGAAQRALVQGALPDRDTRRDLTHAVNHGKDWLFARDASGRAMPVAQAQVPFGTEPQGTPLSDHFGYAIAFAPDAEPPMRFASAAGARR
ncbi:MAG: endonuclease [Sphingomonadaceae bacterium]|nr:endonuclease [Sphingomonadaceae bacterium]